MSPVTTRTRTRRSSKKKKGFLPTWLLFLWPLLAGILVTPFAVRAASVLALNGPPALRLLYPYVIVAQSHIEQLAVYQEETLSQWVLYGQFPLYGVIWMIGRRLVRASGGPLFVVGLHCVGVALAILLPTT